MTTGTPTGHGRRGTRLRSMVLASAFLSVLVSGCVVPGSDGTLGDGAGLADGPFEDIVLPWSLVQCSYTNWFANVDTARLEPYIAEGFTISTGRARAPLIEGDSYLGFEGFDCGSGAGLEGNVSDMVYGSLFTSVDPPEELRIDGVDSYYYKLLPLIPDEERRVFLRGLGMEAVDGSVVLATTDAGPEPVVRDASYTLGGFGEFTFRGSPMPGERWSGGGGVFAEFTPLVDGHHAVWLADYEVESGLAGVGRWTASPGSVAADILGKTEGDARFISGTWTFAPGTVTIPADAVRAAAMAGSIDEAPHDVDEGPDASDT